MEMIKTPHINAYPGDFAPTVLMPGDPLRSKFIAESFLTDARLVNNVRGVQGYTGLWNGKPVSVMASGMGMPSMGIYSYELYNYFGVENIIRVGSAGALQDGTHVGDIIVAMSASTDSNYLTQYNTGGTFAPTASYSLLKKAADEAERMKLCCRVGPVLSSDVFYSDIEKHKIWKSLGILGVEMEAAALYANAAKCGKSALTILTVSDHIMTGEAMDAQARQLKLTDMIKLALNVAIK